MKLFVLVAYLGIVSALPVRPSPQDGMTFVEKEHYSGETIIWESGFSGESGEIVVEQESSGQTSIESSGASGELFESSTWEQSGETVIWESGFSGESGEVIIEHEASGWMESNGTSGLESNGTSGLESSTWEQSGETIIWESGFSGESGETIIEHEASGWIESSGASGLEASGWENSGVTVIEESGLGSGDIEIVVVDGSGEEILLLIDQGSNQNSSAICQYLPDGFYALGCSSTMLACSGGDASHLECPDEMAFDPEKGACDSPANVHLCTGTGFHWDNSTETGSGVSVTSFCASRGDGFFQQGCSSSLIACSDGLQSTLSCPAGLVYSQDKGFCDSPSAVAACKNSSSLAQ